VSYWFRLPLDVRDGICRAHSYIVLVSCFTDACKRNGIPVPVVLPCPLDVKACILKKKPNGLVRELVAILGMDGFTLGEMEIELCGSNVHLMVARTPEVHFDA
jgi:hypothetical protein